MLIICKHMYTSLGKTFGPMLNFCLSIPPTVVVKKLVKIQQCQLANRDSYKTLGCTLAEESHSGFNTSIRYFSNYQMCDLERFL